MIDDTRPDPDRLLADVQRDEARARRGRLRIFFGASAGVGKTFSMLEAARTARADGTDIVVGYVEPHGRPETERLLEGLEQLPMLPVRYRGVTRREFDLDAALQRRAAITLVDELAHTNLIEGEPAPRHAKRWQDIDEMLGAGLDVWTTLNVQHIESLNDVIASITGVRQQETVPDRVLEDASEIELIDLPPEDLLERLQDGQGLRAGAGRRGPRPVLPHAEPARPARARAAPDGGPRGRGRPRVRRSGARLPSLAGARAIHHRRRTGRAGRGAGAIREALCRRSRCRVDRRGGGDAAPAAPRRGRQEQANRGVAPCRVARRGGRDTGRPDCCLGTAGICAHAERHAGCGGRTEAARPAGAVAAFDRPGTAGARERHRHLGDRTAGAAPPRLGAAPGPPRAARSSLGPLRLGRWHHGRLHRHRRCSWTRSSTARTW